ncbi:MAG: hypothetical protein ACREPE_13265 [Lysobacter sp.]
MGKAGPRLQHRAQRQHHRPAHLGYANPITREIVTSNTRFRIANVGKPITSAAIFRLIGLWQLALTDRVCGAGARLGTTFGSG